MNKDNPTELDILRKRVKAQRSELRRLNKQIEFAWNRWSAGYQERIHNEFLNRCRAKFGPVEVNKLLWNVIDDSKTED